MKKIICKRTATSQIKSLMLKKFLTVVFVGMCLQVSGSEPDRWEWGSETREHALFLSVGKPLFTGKTTPQKNFFSFSAHYQYRISSSFAIEPFYLYSQSDCFPDYFNDKQKLDALIRQRRSYLAMDIVDYQNIFTHSVGLRLHFAFIDNRRWYLTFNLAGGYFISESSMHSLPTVMFNWDLITGDAWIIDYIAEYIQGVRHDGFFTMPGVQLQYIFGNGYFVGLDIYKYAFWPTKPAWDHRYMPVAPDMWNAAITFGIRF